jgi:hypothetical protein
MAFEMLRRHFLRGNGSALLASTANDDGESGQAGRLPPDHYDRFSITDRRADEAASAHDFECFAIANPDLMDKSAPARCYRPERLALDAARRTFILPDLAR